jgi:hypothetical protein
MSEHARTWVRTLHRPFLLSRQYWNQADIEILATVAGKCRPSLHTPLGAFLDARSGSAGSRRGIGMLIASALAIATAPNFSILLTAQTMMAVAGVPTLWTGRVEINCRHCFRGESSRSASRPAIASMTRGAAPRDDQRGRTMTRRASRSNAAPRGARLEDEEDSASIGFGPWPHPGTACRAAGASSCFLFLNDGD